MISSVEVFALIAMNLFIAWMREICRLLTDAFGHILFMYIHVSQHPFLQNLSRSKSFRQDVALISVLVNIDCKVRASRATVGMKINAPLLLSRLPNSFQLLNPYSQGKVAQFRSYG